MTDGKPAVMPFRFGPYEADLEKRELRKRGLRIRLADQPFQLLAELLRRPGEVVTREELQSRLWPSDTFVDFERGLNKAINRVRDALNDSAEEPRYIETVPRRGYRFIADIERMPIGASLQPAPTAVEHRLAGAPRRGRLRKALVGASLLAVAVLFAFGTRRPEVPQAFRSSLLPPPETSFLPRHFAVSPDGTRLIFCALGQDGESRLWVRGLSAAEAYRLDNTEGASYPFWSPDGRRAAFFADRSLKVIDLETATVKVLAAAPLPTGGSWSKQGVIVFGAGIAQPLYRIPADGGEPTAATRGPREGAAQTAWWPFFLPDGERFLYSVQWTTPGEASGTGLYAAALDHQDGVLISPEILGNVRFASGRLLFVQNGRVLTQPFDSAHLRTTAPAIPLTESEIETDSVSLRSGFDAIRDRGLVFESALDFRSRLTWFDASGTELGEIAASGYRSPSLSPDGRAVAVACDDANQVGKRAICVYDLNRGVSTRITDGSNDAAPIWSRDGKDLTYESREKDIAYLKRIAADRGSPAQTLREGGRMSPRAWLPDGRLLFTSVSGGGPKMYLTSESEPVFLWSGSEAQLSPDSKWIAQASGGIVVRSLAEPRRHVQIANSGAQPRWRHDGRRLFYIAPDKKLMAASFDAVTGKAGPPEALFQTRIVAASIAGFQYDVSHDGRFLINSLPPVPPLTLITGSAGLLR